MTLPFKVRGSSLGFLCWEGYPISTVPVLCLFTPDLHPHSGRGSRVQAGRRRLHMG